jgi:hypothetical protein
MATHAELSFFTYGEIEEMKLTHLDLLTMSQDDLSARAKEKLKRFKQLPETIPIPPEIVNKLIALNSAGKLDFFGVKAPADGAWNKALLLLLLDKLLDLPTLLLAAWILWKFGP